MYRLFPDKDIICRNIWCFTVGVSTSAGNKERQKEEKWILRKYLTQGTPAVVFLSKKNLQEE